MSCLICRQLYPVFKGFCVSQADQTLWRAYDSPKNKTLKDELAIIAMGKLGAQRVEFIQ